MNAHFEPRNRQLYELVAYYVGRGFTIQRIKEQLQSEHHLDQHENQIYRAVYHAARAGLLHYVPKIDEALGAELSRLCPSGAVEVKVVDESVDFLAKQAFVVASAQVLHGLISSLSSRLGGRTIRVANAGGPTVADAVNELAKGSLDLGMLPNLECVALSQVGYPRQFNRTSTYLAVRLAEIYTGAAYAPLIGNPTGQEYDQKVRETNLFVGGVGAAGRGFWAERKNGQLPPTYCGDLFYIPLRQSRDARGTLEPEPALAREVRRLALRPTFQELREALARGSQVLLLVSDDRQYGKASFVRLLIQNRLVSHLVLGSGLARRVAGS